jgi:hypothetical protein
LLRGESDNEVIESAHGVDDGGESVGGLDPFRRESVEADRGRRRLLSEGLVQVESSPLPRDEQIVSHESSNKKGLGRNPTEPLP